MRMHTVCTVRPHLRLHLAQGHFIACRAATRPALHQKGQHRSSCNSWQQQSYQHHHHWHQVSSAPSPPQGAVLGTHIQHSCRSSSTHRASMGSMAAPATSMHQGPAAMRGVVAGLRLPDAHAHPQDDAEHAHVMAGLGAACVAVMGVKEEDWPNVERLQKLAPSKVIPCFGVHPWFAWQHASEYNRVSSSSEDAIIQSQQSAQVSMRPVLDVPVKQDLGQIQWLVNSMPSTTWEPKLRDLLVAHPEAVVGEFGLDRAAVVPGTKASVTLEHQMALVRTHMSLAAELGRPVSMHCVRAHGPLQELLQHTPPAQLPRKIMLHSFGGSPESVVQLTRLPHGVGARLYFSFSAAINARDAGGREKLVKRIAAVPDDKLLIETDQNTPLAIDSGLEAILDIVAEAKGWDLPKAARVAVTNFEAFYEGFLPPGYSTQADT